MFWLPVVRHIIGGQTASVLQIVLLIGHVPSILSCLVIILSILFMIWQYIITWTIWIGHGQESSQYVYLMSNNISETAGMLSREYCSSARWKNAGLTSKTQISEPFVLFLNVSFV